MASKAVAKAAGTVVELSKKQTLQSTGLWERLRSALAIDPNRSNGVPLNPYFRNPTPGALDPLGYDDPVTTPAGDLADNPYWKRDVRRAYPKLSVVTQADAVGLLTVGSAAAPKVELIGDAGTQQLVTVSEEGKTGGLAAYLEKTGAKEAVKSEGAGVFINGLPPTPSGQSKSSGEWATHKYGLAEESSYGDAYPCRSFQ